MAKTKKQLAGKNGKTKPGKTAPTPEGYARLQFLNQAQKLINNNPKISSNLAHKLNLNYGEIANMVVEKYLIKIEPKRKNQFCRRCKSSFSVTRENFEVVVQETEKHPKMVTTCHLCGYAKPKVLRPQSPKKCKTDFREKTS